MCCSGPWWPWRDRGHGHTLCNKRSRSAAPSKLGHLLVLEVWKLEALWKAHSLLQVTQNAFGEDARQPHLLGLSGFLARLILGLERADALEVFGGNRHPQSIVLVLCHQGTGLPLRAPAATGAIAVRRADEATVSGVGLLAVAASVRAIIHLDDALRVRKSTVRLVSRTAPLVVARRGAQHAPEEAGIGLPKFTWRLSVPRRGVPEAAASQEEEWQ
mmetsp:Transcript_149639/g.461988  ORF Transcript_149639/g.461988 Transcript_149639/m.461988 type:complete len:216 (+) Transcript_149639:141-788(+)